MRFRGIACGLVVLICVSACSSGSGPDPEPAQTQAKVVTPDAAVSMKEGRDFDVIAKLPKEIDGQVAFYEGVSPDGMVYGKTAEEDPEARQPVGPGSTLITTRDDVFLLDPRTSKVTSVSDGASRQQPVGVAAIFASDEWVTWIEIQEGFGASWTLHSYDRSTGKERTLGSQEAAVKGDTGVDIDGPKISGDQVVMSTMAFGDEDAKANQVFSVPLDGSAPLTELIGGATRVDADDDGISFVDVESEALTFRSGTRGDDEVLNDEATSECQLFHSHVLMTCDDEGRIHLESDEGKKVSFGPFTEITNQDLTSGWATFVINPEGAARIYAIDTTGMKLFEVADTQAGWSLMGNDRALIRPFNGAKGDITLIRLR